MTQERPDEKDAYLVTDSFAPPSPDPLTDDVEDDELDKIEDLLPQNEATEAPAALP